MKKLILMFIPVLFLFSNVFAETENIKENNIQKGPTSTPVIVGPKKAPPTKSEIQKIKCEKDEEFIGTKYCEKKEENKIGFWGWFWEWLKNIF